jgi:hypothetical protein
VLSTGWNIIGKPHKEMSNEWSIALDKMHKG